MNGNQYRFKIKLQKEGILTAAKNIKQNPDDVASKVGKQKQVYCVIKRNFYATATPEEMAMELVLREGQAKEEKEMVHRILQSRMR